MRYGSEPAKVEPTDALIRQNLDAMRNQAVTLAELTNARQYEIRSIPVQVSSANGIACSLLLWSWHGEPLDQPMVAAKYHLNLTATEVQDAFKKYLKPQNLTQVVQGPSPAKHRVKGAPSRALPDGKHSGYPRR